MRKVLYRIITFTIVLFFLYIFIFNNSLITNSIRNSFNFFFSSIFFVIYPFMIFIDFVLASDFLKIFNHIKLKSISFFILCIFSSLPMNAYILGNYYKRGIVSKEDAAYLLSFSSIPSIVYTINYAGSNIFGSFKVGIVLYIGILISNIIMYIFNYKYIKNISNNYGFSFNLKESIINNLKNMVTIFGCISLFNLFINIFKYYFNISNIFLTIFNGILELSSGLYMIGKSNTAFLFKIAFSSFILGFNGISILIQQLTLLDIKDINIKAIIKNKIIAGAVSSLLSCLIVQLV